MARTSTLKPACRYRRAACPHIATDPLLLLLPCALATHCCRHLILPPSLRSCHAPWPHIAAATLPLTRSCRCCHAPCPAGPKSHQSSGWSPACSTSTCLAPATWTRHPCMSCCRRVLALSTSISVSVISVRSFHATTVCQYHICVMFWPQALSISVLGGDGLDYKLDCRGSEERSPCRP